MLYEWATLSKLCYTEPTSKVQEDLLCQSPASASRESLLVKACLLCIAVQIQEDHNFCYRGVCRSFKKKPDRPWPQPGAWQFQGGNRRNEMKAVKPVRGLDWDTGAIGNANWGGVKLRDAESFCTCVLECPLPIIAPSALATVQPDNNEVFMLNASNIE
eukprot:683826-Pelagomonas_calceolata.AAC.1